MMDQKQLKETRVLAARIRLNILEMIKHAGSGHMGGSLSIVEVLADLYENHMHVNPQNPKDEDRDVLVLSKGHAGPALYSALCAKGFFDRDMLFTLNQGGTHLPSHPDRQKTPGVDMTTGSLGQGCSTAIGMALAQRKKGINRRTYLICGDGELDEGQCWEAFMFLGAKKIDNVTVFIDANKKQLDGWCTDVMNPFSLEEKMKAFGFHAVTVDGGDLEAIDAAIEEAKSIRNMPTAIVLDTIKGQGVPVFENMMMNHSVRFTDPDVVKQTNEAIEGLRTFIQGETALCTL